MGKRITDSLCKNFEIDPSIPNGLRWVTPEDNRTKPGDPCGTLNKSGYFQTYKNGRIWLNHRLIFFMTNGYEPEFVDHEDTNTLNNNPSNLRDATKSQNQHNHGLRVDNTSGVKGLYFDKKRKKWYGQVCHLGVKYGTGLFGDKEEAVEKIVELRNSLHKDFANHAR